MIPTASIFRKVLLSGLILSSWIQLPAQTDSLKQAFDQQIEAKAYLKAFASGDDLSTRLLVDGKLKKGVINASRVLDLVKSEFSGGQQDSLLGIAYNQLALIHGSKSVRPDTAMIYMDSGLVYMNKMKLFNRMAHAYSNRAGFLNRLSRYSEAIDNLVKAQDLLIDNELDREESWILWSVHTNLALGHRNLAQYEKELEYATKSYEGIDADAYDNNDDLIYRMGISKQFIAIAYLNLKNFDLAKSFIKEGLDLMKQLENDEILLNLYNTLGTIEKDLGNYEEAGAAFSRVAEISKKLNNNVGYAMVLINRGGMYTDTGNFQRGLNDLLKALPICLEMGDYSFLRVVNYNIAEAYEKLGDYKSAMGYYKEYKAVEDSLSSQSTKAQLNEFNIKYETLEKENQLAQQDLTLQAQEATIASQNTRMIGISGAAVVLLLIGLIYYNRSKAQQKAAFQATLLSEKEQGLVAIVEVTESERKRISKDLHDGIGQQLSALKLGLQSLKSTVDGEAQEELEVLTTQFSKSADEVRQISHQMMPRALMENGLVEAIDGLLQNSFRYADVDYTFEHHGIEGRFAEKVEVSLYRILQELVNNVIKHSEATTLSVQLIKSKARLMLLVEDNGKGLDKKNSEGHGLLNIKNRLDMINGEVNFEPSPESGVLATIVVPV